MGVAPDSLIASLFLTFFDRLSANPFLLIRSVTVIVMAEALGAVASVLTLIASLSHVTGTILSCKNATNDSRRLVRELSFVRGLLTTLKETIEQHERTNSLWSSTILSLNSSNEALDQFQQLLDELDRRICGPSQAMGLKKLKSALVWPFKEAETLKLIDAIERYRGLFELALENNHVALTKAIHDTISSLTTEVQDIKLDLQKNADQLDSLNQSSRSIEVELNNSNQWQKDFSAKIEGSEYSKVCQWLSTSNFWDRQKDVLDQRVYTTGSWFLESEPFQNWKSNDSSILLCRGAPGIGKSVLTAVVIDHLRSLGDTTMAFFCNHSDQPSRKYQNLLGSFLQQLLQIQCSNWGAIKDLYDQSQRGYRPDSTDFVKVLREELCLVDRAYVVIDALDEWSSEPSDIRLLLKDIKSLGTNVNVLIMSRPITFIDEMFTTDSIVDIMQSSSDLTTYIRSRLAKDSRCSTWRQDSDLQQLTEKTVLAKCEGLFLLARLQMDQLSQQRHKRGFFQALNSLPTTPNELYDNALARIRAQSEEDAGLAHCIFGWIYYAYEAMTIWQLQYALAIEVGTDTVDLDACIDEDELLSLCGGLIVHEKQSATVRFVHPTTYAYFQHYFGSQFQDFETTVASSLLTFFLSDNFKVLVCSMSELPHPRYEPDSWTLFIGLIGDYRMESFLTYACRSLIPQYRALQAKVDTKVLEPVAMESCRRLMMQLFDARETFALFWWVWMNCNSSGWYLAHVYDADCMCIASFFGLADIVLALLESGSPPDQQDSTGQTALYAAVTRDENDVVDILLKNGASPNQQSFNAFQHLWVDSNAKVHCNFPLHCALRQGNVGLVRLLLQHGAHMQPYLTHADQRVVPLYVAVLSRSQAMVEFVLKERPEDLEAPGPDGKPHIDTAIESGSIEVVDTLLQYDQKAAERVWTGIWNPLETALFALPWRVSDSTCLALCKVIIHNIPSILDYVKCQDFELRRAYYWKRRPRSLEYLMTAMWTEDCSEPENYWRQSFFRILNDSSGHFQNQSPDLDLGTVVFQSSMPARLLQCAVFLGWKSGIRVLLELAERHACGPYMKSLALSEAAKCHRIEIIDALLEAGADINESTVTGLPVCNAIISQDEDMVRHLLSRGANPNIACKKYSNAMHAPCQGLFNPTPGSMFSMYDLLTGYGADANAIDGNGHSLLTVLCSGSSEEVSSCLRFLLGKGADCNVEGGPLFTPLIAAASSPHAISLEILEILLAAGANVNASGGTHGTALLACATSQAHSATQKASILLEKIVHPTMDFSRSEVMFLNSCLTSHHCGLRDLAIAKLVPHQPHQLVTALALSAASGCVETARVLIEKGADVNSQIEVLGTIGTPLVSAITYTETSGDDLQMIQLLLTHGTDINAPALDYANVLQMHLDMKEAYLPVIICLLECGIDINAPSGTGSRGTAAEIALRHYRRAAPEATIAWEVIIAVLARHGAAWGDDDFAYLLQFPFFLEALGMGE